MKIGEYEQMMSWLTRPESPQTQTRENLAIGGGIIQGEDLGDRTGFADPIKKPITDDFFKKYLKSNKGKSFLEMAEDLTSKGYIPATKAAKVLSAEALTGRAARLGIRGAASFIKDQSLQDVLREATDANRLAYKRGEIDEALLRKRVIGKRADIKRYNDPKTYREILDQRKEYRNKIKTDPSMEKQRNSIKESQVKFKAKKYLKDGIPPQAKTAKQFLFRDLFRIAQESEKGDRLKLAKNFAKSDLKAGKFYNNLEIIDTVTGKKFNFNNVEKYISSKNTGFNYKDVIKPYEQKVFINETPGLRAKINSKMIPNWDTGNKNTFFEIQHVEGKYKNPFNVHLASKVPNAREGVVRARFDKAWAKAKTLSDKKELFQEYTDNLPKGIASQPNMITRTREFGERVPFDELLRETKQSGVKLPRGILKDAVRFNSNPMADPGLLKQGLKDMGKFGKYAGQIALSTPAGAVLATKGLGGTFDPRTTEGRLTAGAEAAFAPGLVKGTEAFTKNKILQKVLNLGLSPKMAMRAARVASPIGIATLAGEGIYQGGKYMLERKKLLESLTDEQRDDLLSRERSEAVQQNRRGDPEAFSGIMAANGGLISRQKFEDGSKDPKMNRRTFMKVMSGLASIPLLGKFIKPAAKVAESAAPVVADAPAHFWNLVAKIKTFGDDITQFGALTERQSVKKYKDLELTEDMATGQIEIQRVKVAEDMDYYGSPVTEESYMSYRPGEQIFQETANGKTKIIKSKPDYQEGTTYLRNDGPETGSVLDEMSGLSDDIFEEAGVPVPEAIRKK